MDFEKMRPGQRESIKHLDGPLLICAGAGSGKTFTLTQRIAWALLPGSAADGGAFLDSIDQALVITFTNKAAGEIKDRVRQTLRAEGLGDEALKVDSAWISTIHGMCNRILREHALELGLDPNFTLAIDTECETARAQATDLAIRQARAANRNPYAELFATYRADQVRAMVGTLLTKAGYQTAGLDAVECGPGPRPLREYAAALLEACAGLMEIGSEKNQAEAALLANRLNEWLAGAPVDDARGRIDTAVGSGEGTAAAAATPTAAQLAELLGKVNRNNLRGKKADELRNLLNLTIAELQLVDARPLMDQLMALARKVEGLYQDILASRCALDTSSLIRTTLQAFDEHPAIAAEYTRRFKLIMVDEFQDTSQLQIDMINRIAGPTKRHLCTVGDAQQSIYRFQGADVEVYLQHKRDMLDPQVGALQKHLVDNFRSHGDVLALVRRICGQPGYFSEDFLDLQAKTDGKVYHGARPRVEVALTEYEPGLTTEDAARTEATLIAQRFSELRQAGHHARDMVILMGNTSKSDIYARALREAGFACVVAGGSHFFDRPHVAVCLALLNVLVNPNDSEHLLTVLTSDLLPVSTDDLLWLATYYNEQQGLFLRQNPARGLYQDARAPQQASPLLQHAQTVLTHAWENLGRVRPRALFEQVISESGWLDRLEQQGAEGQTVAADLFKFARLVDEAAQQTTNDMARVTQVLMLRAKTGKEKPGALTASGTDAVRIMTVHASKGLEFPIVAVTDCYTTRADTDQPRMLADGGTLYTALSPTGFKMPKGVGAGEGDDPTDPRTAADACSFLQAIKESNKNREYAEKKRLFYVAATRASDAVLVCLKHKRDKSGNPTAYKDVETDILHGLFGPREDFPHDSGTFEYGGSEPGIFTRQQAHAADEDGEHDGSESRLTATDAMSASVAARTSNAPVASEDATLNASSASAAVAAAREAARNNGAANRNDDAGTVEGRATVPDSLAIPVVDAWPALRTESLDLQRDFFSYSSIADAAHDDADEDWGPQGTASAATPVAGITADDRPGGARASVLTAASFPEVAETAAPLPLAPEDDQVIVSDIDADKATVFGSALHQSCEWIANHPSIPDAAAIEDALQRFARQWNVQDIDRLRRAVDNWLHSDVCAQAFAHSWHEPEVPFATRVGKQVMEGSIDLFSHDDAQEQALVIDYKTGGNPDETPEQLHAKHLLQAQCYALAVMEAGYRQVALRFVRVEQLASNGQPQTVCYEFERSDLSALAAHIGATAERAAARLQPPLFAARAMRCSGPHQQ